MAVRSLSYKDLTPAQRQKGAAEARQRIMSMMANPFLPPDQRAHFEKALEHLSQWEQGTLPAGAKAPVPPSPPEALEATSKPTRHDVQVVETLSVADAKSSRRY